MTTFAIPFAAALLAALAPALALAQSPPIKPGLWEVHSDRQVNGQSAAPPDDAMKKLSPEVRAKMEAMMKDKGMAVGSGGASRICLSKESLDAGFWQKAASCKTDFGARSASTWKWHTVCPENDAVIDGEAVFASPESYTVKTASTHTFRGQARTTRMTLQAKWIGASCGELKPFDPKR